jgi:type II secretory pathway pseudopilin PulG
MTRRHRQNGFILLAALAVLAIVGVAMLTLAAASASDARRSFERARRGQLDQMLLAAAAEAKIHLKQSTPKTGDAWDVELPNVLTEQTASLHTTIDSVEANGDVTVNVHATIANRSAEQTLKFSHASGEWKLVSAEVPL